MIRKYIPILAISLLFSQDIAGNYQFTGLYTFTQNIARWDTDLLVEDKHGLGYTLPAVIIKAGEIYRTEYQGPYGYEYGLFLGITLNINFYNDGSGQIIEGSVYPTIEVENCVASIATLPITDQLTYTSNLDAGETGNTFPVSNILGSIPDGDHDSWTKGFDMYSWAMFGQSTPYGGEPAGGLSLSQSVTFDYFPATPQHPTLCDGVGQGGPHGNGCFDVILEDGSTIVGGDPLPGFAAGYVQMGNLSSVAEFSFYSNDCADLYLEWHAIDGAISQTGLGDIIGEDEDDDGTDFDREWAVEELIITKLLPDCGFNYAIFGDVSAEFDADCVDKVSSGTEGYVWYEYDPASGSPDLSIWGDFFTYNAGKYYTCLNGGGDTDTCLDMWDTDDSDHDFDAACLSDGNTSDCSGRIPMEFTPQCIQDIMVRQIMLEFNRLGHGGCCNFALGDLDDEDGWEIDDIVQLVQCVLGQYCSELVTGCAADLDGNALFNIMDVVVLQNCVIAANCGGRVDDATQAELMIQGQQLNYESDGFVGGIQMTLKHGSDFSTQLTDMALYANQITEGNETRLIIVTPESNEIFTFTGEFEIIDVIFANSHDEIDLILPGKFGLSDAYPNPFNPTTNVEVTLTVSGNMQVDVYNLAGQLIKTLASGYHQADTYSLSWEAANVPSGIYFIQAESGGMISTEKVMLIK